MRCLPRIKRSSAVALAALTKADRLRLVEAIDLLCMQEQQPRGPRQGPGSGIRRGWRGWLQMWLGSGARLCEWRRNTLATLKPPQAWGDDTLHQPSSDPSGTVRQP